MKHARRTLALALASLCFASAAGATQVTYAFSGLITQYRPFVAGSNDAAQLGTAFSGTMVFDVSQAETSSLTATEFTNSSQSGCQAKAAGVCVQGNHGGGTSVVVDWTLSALGSSWAYTPVVGDTYESSNLNQFSDAGSSGFQAQHQESQMLRSSAGPTYTATGFTTELQLFANGAGFLPALGDLVAQPDLADAAAAGFYFGSYDYLCAGAGYGCTFGAGSTGLNFHGSLTSLRITGPDLGNTAVPEPASVSLAVLALAAAALGMRRKRGAHAGSRAAF